MAHRVSLRRLARCLALIAVLLSATAGGSWAAVISLDPKGSFLRTDSTDLLAGAPTIVDLSSIGVAAGDLLALRLDGAFQLCTVCTDTTVDVIGVFSSTATVLPPTEPLRVPGALSAGLTFVSNPTLFEGHTTDIAEDFFIAGELFSVTVPVGAQYLLLGAADVYWGDNVDPNGDLAVFAEPVPEPALLPGLAFALGAGIFAVARRRC